ncbi:MAG: hypothetical protein Kow0069_15150 [Promethearchaeota archaeon]
MILNQWALITFLDPARKVFLSPPTEPPVSFIAKIYLVKMFPKKDCLKVEGDLLRIKWVNVISEIFNKDVPEDLRPHFELKVNGQVVVDETTEEAWQQMRAVWRGTEYTLENYRELQDTTVEVGDEVVLYVPNPGLKPGDVATLEFHVKQDRPIKFKIQRTVGD